MTHTEPDQNHLWLFRFESAFGPDMPPLLDKHPPVFCARKAAPNRARLEAPVHSAYPPSKRVDGIRPAAVEVIPAVEVGNLYAGPHRVREDFFQLCKKQCPPSRRLHPVHTKPESQ